MCGENFQVSVCISGEIKYQQLRDSMLCYKATEGGCEHPSFSYACLHAYTDGRVLTPSTKFWEHPLQKPQITTPC